MDAASTTGALGQQSSSSSSSSSSSITAAVSRPAHNSGQSRPAAQRPADRLLKGLQPQPWLTLQMQQHPTVLLQQSWAQSLAPRCLHRPLARLLVIQLTGSSSYQGWLISRCWTLISRCWTLKRASKAVPWLLALAPLIQAAAEVALVVLRVLCQQQDLVETQQQQAQWVVSRFWAEV